MRVYRSVAPIYFRRHYWIDCIVGCIICVSVNLGLDYLFNHDKPAPYALVGKDLILEMGLFHLIMPIVFVLSTGFIRKEIIKGNNRAVDPKALEDTLAKRLFLFSISEPKWTKRIPLFIAQSLAVPGAIAFLLVIFFCWCAEDFQSLSEHNCSTNDIWQRLAWTELWKGICFLYMHAVNYAAAHNAAQPELGVIDDGSAEASLAHDIKPVDYATS